jgi:hypothetical protein
VEQIGVVSAVTAVERHDQRCIGQRDRVVGGFRQIGRPIELSDRIREMRREEVGATVGHAHARLGPVAVAPTR